MTPLEPTLLAEARTSRDRLLERQHELERARADYNDAVRRLHAAGGSLREIAENLGLSHQRVHQIVDGEAPDARQRRGGRRRFEWPFERFTRRARQVVVLAQEEAASLGHRHIGTEHLLLGVVELDDEPVAAELAAGGVTADAVREHVRERLPKESGGARRGSRLRRGGYHPFTRAAKRALETALREARDLGDNYIGAEHIFVALLGDERSGAVEALRAVGADPDALRTAVLATRPERERR
jgi:hypothetical protein